MTRRGFVRSLPAFPLLPARGQEPRSPAIDVQPRKVRGGFHFTEGPAVDRSGNLFFSDVAEERIYCLSRGSLRVVRNSSNLANGLAFDSENRMIVCERGRLTRTEHDGHLTILADTFDGRGLHWPNDVTVRSDGSVYFTDLKQKNEWANPAKTGVNAVYRWSPRADLAVIARDCQEPNGITLSPREDRLYVSDTAGKVVRIYDPDASGKQVGHVFADASAAGAPDGLKADTSGNLWVCEENGLVVLDQSARRLWTIPVPEPPSNCAFSRDAHTLFITAKTSIYALEV